MIRLYYFDEENKIEKSYSIENTMPPIGESKVWIRNEEGESMTVDTKKIFDLIDKFFKENY